MGFSSMSIEFVLNLSIEYRDVLDPFLKGDQGSLLRVIICTIHLFVYLKWIKGQF